MTRARRRMGALACVMATLGGGAASRAHATPDLRASAPAPGAPQSLRMRRVAQAFGPATAPPPQPQATTQATLVPPRSDDGDDAAPGARARKLGQHVIFNVRGGLALDAAPTSGQAMRSGARPGDQPGDAVTADRELRTQNAYVLGDAVLGSRGVPVSSLHTYFAAQFRLGLSGASENATRPDGWDALGDDAFLLQTGYAELDGWGSADHPLHPLFVRAGRQFHHGGSQLVSQFDGVQLGWHTPDWEVGGFVGRRVALWLGDEPGVLGGGRARVGLRRLVGVPLSLAADVLAFEGERLFVEGGAELALRGGALKLSAHVRGLDAGDGFGLGRAGGRLRWLLGDAWALRVDATAIRAHEVAYDWLAPEQVDIVAAEDGIAIALPRPADALRAGASLAWQVSPTLELYGFGRLSASSGSGANAPWVEAGGAGELALGDGLSVGGQLKLRVYDLGTRAGAGAAFDDLEGSGAASDVELAGEARYRPAKGALKLVAGAYARRSTLRTPYVNLDGDVRGGARVDLELAVNEYARVRAIAEAAQASAVLSPELDAIYALRLIAEASF